MGVAEIFGSGFLGGKRDDDGHGHHGDKGRGGHRGKHRGRWGGRRRHCFRWHGRRYCSWGRR